MMQMTLAIEFDGKIIGTSDFSKMENSELVIITAGEARKSGMTRIELMDRNAKIVSENWDEGRVDYDFWRLDLKFYKSHGINFEDYCNF